MMAVGALLYQLLSLAFLGTFFFGAGFRGVANAALLSVAEVSNELTRSVTPMIFSLGWGLGLIPAASNFPLLTVIATFLTLVAFGLSYKMVKDSPRFEVIKRRWGKAKSILA